MRFSFPALASTAALAFGLGAAPGFAETLTLYSAQHPQVNAMLIAAFTRESGIAVRLREGEGPELASEILQEGADSPADVFFTENSPELDLLDEKGLLAPADKTTAAQVPARYSAADGHWLGVLARENVLAYDPALIRESALPASLLDLGKPEWKGKFGFAPSDADFLPLVSAVIRQEGKARALAWLQGLKANGTVYQDDEGAAAAVARGSVAFAIINNYYWYRLENALGAANIHSRLYHFKGGDIGGLVNISGAGVLKSSAHPKAAQQFLAFLVSAPAQQMLGESDIDFEYPLRPGIPANPRLRPLRELQPPPIDPAALGDDREAGALLQQAGLI